MRIGSGLVSEVGNILRENGFPKKLLLVADKNTLKAADGIVESLEDFEVSFHIYDNIRVAMMEHVRELEALVEGKDIGILSVGTGSVNDPCRTAAARGAIQKRYIISRIRLPNRSRYRIEATSWRTSDVIGKIKLINP